MNANSAGTSLPHLDLEDLIAEADGRPIADRARQHLAGCDQCRLEASRWTLVAVGVRSLAADAPEPSALAPATPGPDQDTVRPVQAPSGPRPPRRRRSWPAGRRARLAGSAAAGLVLVGGAVYGVAASNLVHLSWNKDGGNAPAAAALTAVNGCSRLALADGTLTQASGGRLVITTASGQRVTVTTTASTFVSESGPLLRDVADGASVRVAGARAAGTITALVVTVGDLGNSHPQLPAADVVVQGTVADATADGFTVVTADGARISVAGTADTVVNLHDPASLGPLPTGATAYALGQAGPGRTLSAQAVAVIAQLPPGGPQLHANVAVHVKDCSPASVNGEVTALAFGG